MRTGLMTAVGLLWVLTTASAQAVTTFADLPVRLNIGDDVSVEDRSGTTANGTVLRLTPEEIVVTTNGAERVFSRSSVRRVQKRGDSLASGMKIGAIVGGALGGAFAGAFSGEFRGSDFMQGVAIFGGVGLGLGLAIDAVNVGSTTVFTTPDTSAMRQRHGGDGVAVRATWTW